MEGPVGLEEGPGRNGCPVNDDKLCLVVDNVPPKPDEASQHEQTLLTAAHAEVALQDHWHVGHDFSNGLGRHHPDHFELGTSGFRDASRTRVTTRDPVCEREVDLAVLRGDVGISRTFQGKKTTVVAWKAKEAALKEQLKTEGKGDLLLREKVTARLVELQAGHLSVHDLADAKRSGLHHVLFSTSTGNGIFVPCLVRQPGDAADSFARHEASVVDSQHEQLLDCQPDDNVRVTSPGGSVRLGTVAAVKGTTNGTKTLAASPLEGKVIVKFDGASCPTIVKTELVSFPEERLWRAEDHVLVARSDVRECCSRFRWRRRDRADGLDGAPLCPSIDLFLKDVANAALRVSKSLPPDGIPQHERLRHRGTGELLKDKSGLPPRRQLHHAQEGSHRRMQRVPQSNNLKSSNAISLPLPGINGLNRLSDANAGVPTTGHPRTHLDWERKHRRLTNPGALGASVPPELVNVSVPSDDDHARAKPEGSPNDQVGLQVTSRLDDGLGRRGRAGTRVDPEVAPKPACAGPRAPPGSPALSPKCTSGNQPCVESTAELETELDRVSRRVDEATESLRSGCVFLHLCEAGDFVASLQGAGCTHVFIMNVAMKPLMPTNSGALVILIKVKSQS